MTDTRIPRLAVGCRVRNLPEGEAMLLVPEGALRLKGSAVEIVNLIDGQRSIEDIAATLQARHSKADPLLIATEVQQFLAKMNTRSVLFF